jgi:hypothetical protein
MNIIDRIFKGGTVEQATDAVLDELAGEQKRKREIEAERIARERRQTAEYQTRVRAQASELRGRLNESLDELGDLVPRLLLACSHFNTIAAEVQEKGLGFDAGPQLLEDVFCLAPDFGSRLIASIREISPRTEWDYGHIGILGKGVKAERPKFREPQAIAAPRFQGDNAAPPGFVGAWDVIHGRPFVENIPGTSATFLP